MSETKRWYYHNNQAGIVCVACGKEIALGARKTWERTGRGKPSRNWHVECTPNDGVGVEGTKDDAPETTVETVPETVPAPAAPNGWLEGLARELFPYIDGRLKAKTSIEDVQAIVKDLLRNAVLKSVTQVEVKDVDGAVRDCGIQHFQFPKLLKALNARDKDGNRLNVWCYGPPGTGKSTAGYHAAKALETEFYVNGAIASAHELFGYCDAAGAYHTTPFRQAWERGGTWMFDEVSGSERRALIQFNGALANGWCTFPDSPNPVRRHRDNAILGGDNSTGLGGTMEIFREKMDISALDRWVFLEFPIDEALELATAANADWCKKVQAYRARVASKGIKGHVITPRATHYGAALLAAGLDEETVLAMAVKKGMKDADWASIQN